MDERKLTKNRGENREVKILIFLGVAGFHFWQILLEIPKWYQILRSPKWPNHPAFFTPNHPVFTPLYNHLIKPMLISIV